MNCLKCNSNITAENFNSKNWCVVKITELKQRGFQVSGVPHSGFVIVRGWKISKMHDFTTNICDRCVKNNLTENKKLKSLKKLAYKKRQFFLNILGPMIGLGILIFMDNFIASKPTELPSKFENYVVLFGIFSIFLPVLHLVSNPKLYDESNETEGEIVENFHRTFMNYYQNTIKETLGKNIFPLILHPEPLMPGPYIDVDMHFIIPQKSVDIYINHEQKTGWSRIDYYAQFGTSAPGRYDRNLQRTNLANFGFKHWGEFLSKSIDELKFIDGVSDIKN
ncbi:hypothetical protein MNBD_UNCLBAC01-1973 [hydrothermal vent metagenome]|uniref:Uncharacterized protein n=1 Tax=hydrothermal vent metagenome TaxID=652676 RepID=A0A3B1D3W0_9ZZZZ